MNVRCRTMRLDLCVCFPCFPVVEMTEEHLKKSDVFTPGKLIGIDSSRHFARACAYICFLRPSKLRFIWSTSLKVLKKKNEKKNIVSTCFYAQHHVLNKVNVPISDQITSSWKLIVYIYYSIFKFVNRYMKIISCKQILVISAIYSFKFSIKLFMQYIAIQKILLWNI